MLLISHSIAGKFPYPKERNQPMSEIKPRNISLLDDVVATLIVSGYSAAEIETLTAVFSSDTGSMNDLDFIVGHKRLEMTRSLSKEWLVHKLTRLAEGTDPVVAVNALRILAELSENS